MRLRSLFLLLILALVTAFTALNWSVFMADTPLSLGVTTLHAPLGLIMLGLLVFVVAYGLVYVLYLQTNVLMDTRRNAKELQTHRELADKAEASRFTELRRAPSKTRPRSRRWWPGWTRWKTACAPASSSRATR
jgi:uncharacterized integral membrane protein